MDFPVCTSLEEMRALQRYFNQIKTSTVQVSDLTDHLNMRLFIIISKELLRNTGCHLKCSSRQFKIMKTTQTDMLWINDWVSEVTTSYKKKDFYRNNFKLLNINSGISRYLFSNSGKKEGVLHV